MPGRSTLLLVNPDKPAAAQAAAEIRRVVAQHGTLLGEVPADATSLPAKLRSADLFVVLGGDGTLLAQARRCASPTGAMLGVNLGRLGFLAAWDVGTVLQQARVLFGETPLPIREYNLLSVSVLAADGREKFSSVALNDAVVTAGPPYRLIVLSLSVDGREGPMIRGDGIIIASPVGSTAYNLSAGGPVLDPTLDAFAITPIAAQSLSFRPVVVAGSSRIELTLEKGNRADADSGASEAGHGTTLMLDGQIHCALREGDRIVVTKHDHGVRFVQNDRSDWWSRLIGRLHWAASPKLG
jgi:NAD+ kinase